MGIGIMGIGIGIIYNRIGMIVRDLAIYYQIKLNFGLYIYYSNNYFLGDLIYQLIRPKDHKKYPDYTYFFI